jgi:hypothetical protein
MEDKFTSDNIFKFDQNECLVFKILGKSGPYFIDKLQSLVL